MYNYSEIKTHVLDYMHSTQLDTYTVGEVTYNCTEEFKKYNSLLDSYRNESFTKIFPQFEKWYKEI